MSTFDCIVAVVLLVSLLLGLWRGLVYELLSVLSWFAAFVLAQWFAGQAADALPLGNMPEPVRYVIGFLAVFVGALFAGGLVAWMVKKLVEAVGLRPVDRTLGALFGIVRAVLLVLVVAVVVHVTGMASAAWWAESVTSGVAAAALRGMKPAVPERFGKYLPE